MRVYLLLCLTLWTVQTSAETLRVGVKPVPPFAMLDGEGGWTGISVELRQRIAEQLGWQTEWVVMDSPKAQIEGLAADRIDVALGALSMTPEREAVTHLQVCFPMQQFLRDCCLPV